MTDNEKIARWVGWTDIWQGNTNLIGKHPNCATDEEVPDYPNAPAACFGLLDVLVSKGCSVIISCASNDGWIVDVHGINDFWVQREFQCTKEQAIISAVLQVIDKETQGEM